MGYKINKKGSSFINILKPLKENLLEKILDKDDLELIAFYIIQSEIFFLLQKNNIFGTKDIFDKIFIKKTSKSYLKSYYESIDLLKSEKNGPLFLILPEKPINFDFESFSTILGNFFETCAIKNIDIDSFTIGLTFEYLMASTKKSKTGSFYTPLHLVKLICKKAINNHLFYVLKKEEFLENYSTMQTFDDLVKTSNAEEKDKLYSIIRSTTILDPSMGVGNFLIEAFDYLLYLYSIFDVDGKEDKIKILKKQIFGLDINKTSTKIAQIRLLLVLIEHGFNIKTLEDLDFIGNLITINSLTSLPPMKNSLPFKISPKDNKFSVILSNPPYGAKLTNQFKKEAKNHFLTTQGIQIHDKFLQKNKLSKGNPNSAVLFTEICGNLLSDNGFCAIILPKSLLYIEAWESLRVYLSEKEFNVVSIIDLQKGFDKVLLEQIICIFNKRDLTKRKQPKRNSLNVHIEEFNSKGSLKIVSQGVYFNFNKIIITSNQLYRKIFNQIEPWNNFLVKSHRGLVVSKYLEKESSSTTTAIIRGRDIQPLFIRSKSYCPKEYIVDQPYFSFGTLMIQRIIAHVNKPKPHIILTVALNPGKPTVDTIVNIYTEDKGPEFSKALAMYLHSEFINWYTYHFIYCDAIRSMDMFGYYLNQVPIKYIEDFERLLIPYFELLTFLKTLILYKVELIERLQSKIDFLERTANALIYYLYLRNLNTSELDNITYFDKINHQSFAINCAFDFDNWYKKEQFCQVDEWSVDIDNLINYLDLFRNNSDIIKTVDYIEHNDLVKSIINEFRN